MIKDANRIVTVTDRRGRKLGIKRVANALTHFRLARLLGADAGNAAVMNQALMYTAVVSINGDPVPFPRTELQLEALIDRLDLDAWSLVSKVQRDEFSLGTAEEQVAEAKKLVRDDELRQRLGLVQSNVPYDVAFSLTPAQRLAYTVILGQLQGGRFDWSRMAWH